MTVNNSSMNMSLVYIDDVEPELIAVLKEQENFVTSCKRKESFLLKMSIDKRR